MFTRIHIKGFRTCRDVELNDLGQVTALIGRNGSGKTNILKGIEWAAGTAVGGRSRAQISNASVELEVSIGTHRFRYANAFESERSSNHTHGAAAPRIKVRESLDICTESKRMQVLTRAGSTIKYRFEGQSSTIKAPESAPMFQVLASVLPDEDPLLQKINPLTSFLRAVRYYPFDEPAGSLAAASTSGYVEDKEYTAWSSQRNGHAATNDNIKLQLIFLWKEERGKFDEFVSIVGPNGLNLVESVHVLSYKVKAADNSGLAVRHDNQKGHVLTFRPPGSKSVLVYSDLSAGTRRILRLIVSMIFDESSVMLIEQPEDSIHTGLLKKVIPLFRDTAGCQVMMATHSSTVMNLLRPEELRLVTSEAGETSVRALTAKEAAVAEKYMTEEGPLADIVQMVQGV